MVYGTALQNAPVEQITSFRDEINRLSTGTVGTVLVGDLNVWHKTWLKFSPANSSDGNLLYDVAQEYGMKQLVKEPTHEHGNLLDLVLSSVPFAAHTSVTPKVADHNGVLVAFDVPGTSEILLERYVWDYKRADWGKLRGMITACNWESMSGMSVDDAAEFLTRTLLEFCAECIPRRKSTKRKKSHPWMTKKCMDALQMKAAHENSPEYDHFSKVCSDTISAEFEKYVQRVRAKVLELPSGSKAWWALSSQLLDKAAPRSLTSALKTSEGVWVHEPQQKAQLFADTFSKKFVLPPEASPLLNSADLHTDPVSVMNEHVPIRSRWTAKILKSLRHDQATGPDKLPSRILQICWKELTHPVTTLGRKILHEGKWPVGWKLHWLMPLYKRKSVYDSTNYRGLHLTPVISKVIERILACALLPFLMDTKAFGHTQWAFQKGVGCKDLITVLICRWLLGFQNHEKIGVYLSDISGAFDRVEKGRLLEKLRLCGLNSKFLQFFDDFLDPRSAVVVVDGASACPLTISNMVYQGTVLGPYLWNIFFTDVSKCINDAGFIDTKFADDLSATKHYPHDKSNDAILTDLRQCQQAVHLWGDLNRVAFDPGKEEFAVLDSCSGCGEPFRLLGPIIDNKLCMDMSVDKIYKRAKPKACRILRARRFYSIAALISQFKAHVWGIIEGFVPAIYHAAPSTLARIDGIQTSFLCALDLNEDDGFLRFGMVPLCMRRDIGMLGVLYKCAHGLAHSDLLKLFPLQSDVPVHTHHTRTMTQKHGLQLLLRNHGDHRIVFHRSLFGLVKVWNALPNFVVSMHSVKNFQSELMSMARDACRLGTDNWQHIFTPPFVHQFIYRYNK